MPRSIPSLTNLLHPPAPHPQQLTKSVQTTELRCVSYDSCSFVLELLACLRVASSAMILAASCWSCWRVSCSIVGLHLYPGPSVGPRLDLHTWLESLRHAHGLATSMHACEAQ
jgi:hypothetical protein